MKKSNKSAFSGFWMAVFLFSLAMSQSSFAAPTARVLSGDGELYAGRAGLMSEVAETAPEHDQPVLLLEISGGEDSDGEDFDSVLLVPGTEDARTESEAVLIREPKSSSVTVVWRSTGEDGLQLRFASYSAEEGWSEVQAVSLDGAPAVLFSAPKLVLTRDSYEIDLPEEQVTAERSTIHLLWQDAGESPGTFYTPLIFVEGHYIGWHQSFDLSQSFFGATEDEDDGSEEGDDASGGDDATEEPEPATLTNQLARAIDLKTARDERSIFVTFANPASHRLGIVEIRVLPLELSLFGDQVYQAVLDLADLYDPDDVSSLAGGMFGHIVVAGANYNFNPTVVDYLSNQLHDWLMEFGGSYGWSGYEDLAEDLRNFGIDVSNEIYSTTIIDSGDPSSTIVQIDIGDFIEGLEGPQPAQLLEIDVRCELPAPAIGEGPTTIHASRDGRDLLIAWEDEEGGAIHYTESHHNRGDGAWSESLSLALDEALSAELAHHLLRQKIR